MEAMEMNFVFNQQLNVFSINSDIVFLSINPIDNGNEYYSK
jgi:hypothetical protein